jgi:nitrite reductase/ring-hydroxylating ferredoxin subunit
MPLLEARKLSKTFGGLVAVNAVEFSLAPGMIASLIGPNGAGKTTVFNMITGLYPPSQGGIFFQGYDITGWRPNRITARGTYHAPPRPRAARGGGGPADGSGGNDLGLARGLAPGDSQAYTDPASGEAALVIRRPDGRLYALSALCTHAGCRLEYSRDALICPCHHSSFDIRSGAPERGPARTPLATARVTEREGRIVARPLMRS